MAYTSDPEGTFDHNANPNNIIHEDLLDRVAIMSPVDTPLLAVLPRGPDVGNTIFEWTMDEIADANETAWTTPNALAAQVEGADATFPTADTRQRAADYVHIVSRYVDVSDTLRGVNTAGVDDEFSFRIYKKMLEAAKQFDYNLHWSTSSAGSSSTARKSHGLMAWAFYTGTDTNAPVINGYAIADEFSSIWYDIATGAQMTRDLFNSQALAKAWDNGMTIQDSFAFSGAGVKRVISTFALAYDGGTNTIPLNHRHIAADAYMAIDTIDCYESDFGRIWFNLDRHMNGTTGNPLYNNGQSSAKTVDIDESLLILEPRFLRIRMLRGLSYKPLAQIGDATKGMVVMEGGIEVSNPIALIGVNNVVNG